MQKILKNLADPFIEDVRDEVKRERAQPAQPTVLEGLNRALRRCTTGLLHDGATPIDSDFHEISAFTPWKNYGGKFEESIRQFKAMTINVETDQRASTHYYHDRNTGRDHTRLQDACVQRRHRMGGIRHGGFRKRRGGY